MAVHANLKAAVDCFLYGGCDYANFLPPYDVTTYGTYYNFRPDIAISANTGAADRSALTATVLTPTVALPGGRQFALHPSMASLLPYFNTTGKMAAIFNVGSLVVPLTKAQYVAGVLSKPGQLQSHNDQQAFNQSNYVEGGPSGYFGRAADYLYGMNTYPALTCVTIDRNTVLLGGNTVKGYTVGPGGPRAFSLAGVGGGYEIRDAVKPDARAANAHVIRNEVSNVVARSIDTEAIVTAALAAGPTITTSFPGTAVGQQFYMLARLISVSAETGTQRIFGHINHDGYDDHANLANPGGLTGGLASRLSDLAAALKAFYDFTVEFSCQNKVVTFTSSDFGRTLVSNTKGSDHGWGGYHLVIGGAVNGKAFYGTAPTYADDGADDFGQGRLIPTTSTEQVLAPILTWMGVAAGAQMNTVLPNLAGQNAPLTFI